MTLSALEDAAARDHLAVLGHCAALSDDNIGDGVLALLGPKEPGFWAHVQQSPEFQDGKPDPLDRWSTRVITKLAGDLGARPFFPFGTPARPFIGWALRTGRTWASPVGLLVHDEAGLMVSFRGAVLLQDPFSPPKQKNSPCETCEKPCLSACPVDAFATGQYNVPACLSYLGESQKNTCITNGCEVRKACPISQTYGRSEAQSGYHMSVFHKNNTQS